MNESSAKSKPLEPVLQEKDRRNKPRARVNRFMDCRKFIARVSLRNFSGLDVPVISTDGSSEAQLFSEHASRDEGNIEVSKTFCEQGRLGRRNVQRGEWFHREKDRAKRLHHVHGAAERLHVNHVAEDAEKPLKAVILTTEQ